VTSRARTLGGLLEGVDAELFDVSASQPVDRVTTDSRTVSLGDVFVAIRGATHDGHRFAAAARDELGGVVLVERGSGVSGPRVELSDTTKALPVIAANRHGWPGRNLRAWGLTGTNGKTTTSHLLSAILTAAEIPHARLGTTGNWVVNRVREGSFTTPFPLELQALLAEAVDAGARDLVMEVSSHALDQDRVAPLRYAGVALTSFSQDHLDYHPTMQAYLDAKLRLVSDYLESGGPAVAPLRLGTNEMARTAARAFLELGSRRGRAIPIIRADEAEGIDAGVDAGSARVARLHDVTLGAGRCRFTVDLAGQRVEIDAPLVGDFNVDNLAVATVLALEAGIPASTIHAALRDTSGAPGRLERVPAVAPATPEPAVFVDYAHTPDAVARALEALRPHTPGRLIVVLGCGGDRDRDKRPKMGAVAAAAADVVWATSDNPRTEDPGRIVDMMLAGIGATSEAEIHREVDRARAIASAISTAGPTDTVLLAGKGHEDYQVIGTTRRPFDDCQHATDALNRWRTAAARND
jgi:UDP-N-acetylmuramoyl-L-alanyl-D-glutamate--2,6-diaminopimelate ligase